MTDRLLALVARGTGDELEVLETTDAQGRPAVLLNPRVSDFAALIVDDVDHLHGTLTRWLRAQGLNR